MDWRKDIHIEEIESEEKFNFQKENKNKHTFSKLTNACYQEGALAFLSVLGVMCITTPSVFPALGFDSFMGLDSAIWYDGAVLVSLTSGVGLVLSALSRTQKSPFMKKIFSYLPKKGKYSCTFLAVSLLVSQLFFILSTIPSYNNYPFKTLSEWNTLESLHMDSRDPVKRAQFEKERELKAISLQNEAVDQAQAYTLEREMNELKQNMMTKELRQQQLQDAQQALIDAQQKQHNEWAKYPATQIAPSTPVVQSAKVVQFKTLSPEQQKALNDVLAQANQAMKRGY